MSEFSEAIYEQIADYLNNRLEQSERDKFEVVMNSNTALKQEVNKIIILRETAKRNELRERIKAIQAQKLQEWSLQEAENEEIKPKYSILKRVSISGLAASIAILFYFIFTPISLPNQAVLIERGINADLNPEQQLNFDNYLIAQKALELGQNEKAITYFEKVIHAKDVRTYYKDASTWFLAVSKVKESPLEAKIIISLIAANKDFKYPISTIDKLKIQFRIFLNENISNQKI